MMTSKTSWMTSIRASLLLLAAIVIIRVMQWTYNYRLISYAATARFFLAAKHFEQMADRLIDRC